METLLVGIDVSPRPHHIGFTNGEATQRWGRLTAPHDAAGAGTLAAAKILPIRPRPVAYRGFRIPWREGTTPA